MAKIQVTGAYTAYLAALAARRGWEKAVKADVAAFQAFREAYPDRAPAGRQPCDDTHDAAVKACSRMLDAGAALDWERFHAGDWEPCAW